MLLSTVKGCFPAVSGLDTSHCSTAQTMSTASTRNSANLTNFYPNWSMAHSRKVSLFSWHLPFCLCSFWRHFFNRGIPNRQLVQETTVGAAVCWMAERAWVRATLLATELQPVPGAGGSRRGNAEASLTPAAVDHSGERSLKTKRRCHHTHPACWNSLLGLLKCKVLGATLLIDFTHSYMPIHVTPSGVVLHSE